MSPELLLLLANAAATWQMCGVIWFVQVVHYPLFGRYESQHFRAAMAEHQRRTTRVVVGPMVVEFVTSLALLALRPDGVPIWSTWLGTVLVGVWGVSTVLVQIPLHDRLLAGGYDELVHRRLVRTNAARTVAWTARAVLCGWMLLAAKG